MANKGAPESEPFEVKLPQVFAQLAEDPGTQWTLLKVDQKLDWRNVLGSARLRFPAGGPPEVLRSTTPVEARVVEDAWNQFLPLRPASAGSHKLVVGGRMRMALQITQATANLKATEAAVREVEEQHVAAERRRAAGAAHQRALADEARKKALARFQVSSLTEALNSVGFNVGGGGDEGSRDEQEGAGDESAGPGQAAEEVIHLKPLSPEEANGASVPLAFWSPGPFPAGGGDRLAFKCYELSKPKGMRLVGKLKDAPYQQFVGARAKVARRPSSYRYLLGMRGDNSRRLFIAEAEVYHVDLKKKPAPKAEPDAQPALNYGQAKGKLVEEMGTVKKQRQSKLLAARKSREFKVAQFGSYSEELAKRAVELKAKVVSVEQQDEALKAKILPPFDAEATDPAGVYRNSLKRIAPPEFVQKESALADPELVQFLLTDPRAQLKAISAAQGRGEADGEADGSALGPCRTRISLAVLSARLRTEGGTRDVEAARRIARQLSVLNCLALIVSKGPTHRGGKCLPSAVAELTGLAPESPLAAHWHAEYYEEMLGRRKVRALNGRRALCGMIIWALHAAPGLALELNAAVERELRLNPGQLKKGLEYVGCLVTEEKTPAAIDGPLSEAGSRLRAKLEGPPKINRAHYDRQAGGGDRKNKRART